MSPNWHIERERDRERTTNFENSSRNSQIILIQVTRFGSLLNCNIILLRKNEGDNIQSEVLGTFYKSNCNSQIFCFRSQDLGLF